jgi:hypothetical protein
MGQKTCCCSGPVICVLRIIFPSTLYQKLHWSIVNRFPKLIHYPQAKEMALVALKAIGALKKPTHPACSNNDISKPKVFRSGSRNPYRAKERILADSDCNSFLVGGSHLATSTNEGEDKLKKVGGGIARASTDRRISYTRNIWQFPGPS